jgi:hypothetical protein
MAASAPNAPTLRRYASLDSPIREHAWNTGPHPSDHVDEEVDLLASGHGTGRLAAMQSSLIVTYIT